MRPCLQHGLRAFELAAVLIAVACGCYLFSVVVLAQRAERAADHLIREGRDVSTARGYSGGKVKENLFPSSSVEVMGRLRIPELNLSVPMMRDYQAHSLRQGIGHIPGTAMPGGLGTVGLAGHRDTYFRALRGIKVNMDIQVADSSGTYHYSVDSTEVVSPDAVRVLDIQSRPELTLITCYPFNYIGAAPERFIVHAHLISALPDEK